MGKRKNQKLKVREEQKQTSQTITEVLINSLPQQPNQLPVAQLQHTLLQQCISSSEKDPNLMPHIQQMVDHIQAPFSNNADSRNNNSDIKSLLTQIGSIMQHNPHSHTTTKLFQSQGGISQEINLEQLINCDSLTQMQSKLEAFYGGKDNLIKQAQQTQNQAKVEQSVQQPQVKKQRPIRTLFDCSPTLQALFKESKEKSQAEFDQQLKKVQSKMMDRLNESKGQALGLAKNDKLDKQTNEKQKKNISQLKQSIQQLETWSKGNEGVQQHRQPCMHQAFPQSQRSILNSQEVKDLLINSEKTFFIVNDCLWSTQRPQRLQVPQILYGIAAPAQQEFQMMIDINRCLLLTTSKAKKIEHKEHFSHLLQDLLRVQPAQFDKKLYSFLETYSEVSDFCIEKKDSNLSITQERQSLVYALLQLCQQIRGLLYNRLLKVMVVVGHLDIECCYLMPSENEQAKGILADDYYQNLFEQHAEKMSRKRDKVIKYIQYAFNTFQRAVNKLIKSGVMDRLFNKFDFFCHQHRDPMNPESRRWQKAKAKPKRTKQKIDEFGDISFSHFHSDCNSSSGSDSDSYQCVITEDKITYFSPRSSQSSESVPDEKAYEGMKHFNYETFICGFFQFFVVQDPFITQYLNQPYIDLSPEQQQYRENLVSDQQLWQKQFMTQWVQVMVELGVFESTSQFGKVYSNGLQYLIQKQYYDNLKTAQMWKMPVIQDESPQVIQLKALLKIQPSAHEPKTEYMKWLANDGSGFLSPFECRRLPLFQPTKDYTINFLKKHVDSYLCDYCCSHRMVKFQSTLSNSFDVIQCFVGSSPSIVRPPLETGKENFMYTSFTCSCERKSMLTMTDINGQQRMLKPNADDRQLYEMMRVGGGMVYRHQKILQVKEVDALPDTTSSEEETNDEEYRPFTTFNQIEALLPPDVPPVKPVALQEVQESQQKNRDSEDEKVEVKEKKKRKKNKSRRNRQKKNEEQAQKELELNEQGQEKQKEEEPIDQELEQEIILFKQKLQSKPLEVYPQLKVWRGRKKPNISEEWLNQLRLQLK